MLRNLLLSVFVISFLIFGGVYVFGGRSGSGSKENKIDARVLTNKEIVPLGEGQNIEEISRRENGFEHKILGFSFEYFNHYSISSFGNYYDSVGETILLQGNPQGGLQIHITPFDEDISLTISRIKKDIPSLNITETREVVLGSTGIQMVTFKSTNNLTTGSSLEAWFVNRNQLYQISASATSKDLFDKIISTWQFE